jgi:hypothetical protein
MRRRLAIAAVSIACVLGGSAATIVQAAPVAIGKTCGAGYVHANLPWGEKCLRAGEFCKVGNHAYYKYGFTCPATGHLRRR